MGRLMRFKGFEQAIQAVASLGTSHPGLHLQIIGEGPQAGHLARLVDTLGVGDRVEFTGALDQRLAREHLRDADLFVLYTAGEGQSHTILEALAAGAPVLTTRVRGNLELIAHGDNGWLVPWNDQQSLVAAIDNLLRDRELADALAIQGRRTAAGHPLGKTLDGTVNALVAAQ
jgi:glycosyltransferase involved in cell wall biosynthesis